MPRLIQLPDGRWVKRKRVVAIWVQLSRDDIPTIETWLPARLTLSMSDGSLITLDCASNTEAQRLRDQLASDINNWSKS